MDRYLPHLALAVLVGFIAYSIYMDERRANLGGTEAAAFSIPNLDGSERSGPQDHEGKVVVLDFWATWCGPCQASMPMIERLHDAYPDTDFTLMSVNIDEGRGRESRVQSFVQRFGLSFDVWLDPGQAAAAYGVSNIPYVVIIDREGVVRHVHTGNVSERRLRGEIETLL